MIPMRSPRAASHREKILAACATRGVSVTQTPGGAWRLYGGGVDITVTDLFYIHREDLSPVAVRPRRQ